MCDAIDREEETLRAGVSFDLQLSTSPVAPEWILSDSNGSVAVCDMND